MQTISILTGTRSAAFPWVVALNTEDGEKQIAVSNNDTPGIITFYNNLSDSGNTVRIEKAEPSTPRIKGLGWALSREQSTDNRQRLSTTSLAVGAQHRESQGWCVYREW